MGYTKIGFIIGQVLKAAHMNHIEAGIAKNAEDIKNLQVGIDKDTITAAVNAYLNENPVNAGVTTDQAASLWAILQKTAFTEQLTSAELTAFKTAWGLAGGSVEPDTPVDPAVTLTSISAEYNGGDVATGTAVTDLIGITVTATYSDGTTATVTGYTLSGEIAEGSNIITVSYGGKTTTFTVTGVTEEVTETWTSGVAYDLTDKIKENTTLNQSTGAESTATNSMTIDFLYCFDADYIYYEASTFRIFYYDVNKNYISNSYENKGPRIDKVPENAVFCRMQGNPTYWKNKVIPITKAENNCTLGEHTIEYINGYIDANGAHENTSSSSLSKYLLPVAGVTKLTADKGCSQLALYDENQNFICKKQTPPAIIDFTTLPYASASYLRMQNGPTTVTLE